MISSRAQRVFKEYPRQFWLMFVGMLISTIGSSMIWPFWLVYISDKLDTPMTVAASLFTLNSFLGLTSSFIGGPIIDRLGRKWIMIASLGINGLAYIFLGNANTFFQFAILLGITGSVNPLYRVGADAMMADILPPEKRIDGYALFRLSNNLGIAIGPAIGGFIAASSFTLAFYLAAFGMITYCILLILFARETLPSKTNMDRDERNLKKAPREKLGGYLPIIKDYPYISFISSFTLVSMCASLIWVLLPVHATENYAVPMQKYGFIPTTNAIMVVTLQLFITRITKRYPTLSVVTVGAFFYMLAVGLVSIMNGFWGFWICMVIMTIGELIIVPTSSTYVANRAPVDKRGRYMSLYALTWGVASGIAPVLGGFLNDSYGPTAIWIGGGIIGLLSVIAFSTLDKRSRNQLATGTS